MILIPIWGGVTAEFARMFPDLVALGQVINSSRNFSLLPDLGPLIEDHLLLVSKAHIPSFAAVKTRDLKEARNFTSETINLMKQLHPDCEIFAFEHAVGKVDGQVIQCGTCNSTDHAHLHLLPLPARADGGNTAQNIAELVVSQYGLDKQEMPGLPDIRISDVSGEKPYLYLWSSNGNKAFILVQNTLTCSIPSQIVRKMIAIESLGMSEQDDNLWDWRNFTVFYPEEVHKRLTSTVNRWHKN